MTAMALRLGPRHIHITRHVAASELLVAVSMFSDIITCCHGCVQY